MTAKIAEAKIINRGRGPEIAGTRITVYDVMDYYKNGWHRDQIAVLFRLSSRDIQAAIDYIESHKEEVEAEYQKILERHRNYQYPEWVQKLVDESRERSDRRLNEIRERRAKEQRNADDHVVIPRFTSHPVAGLNARNLR
jgi:uncharacterized protein (DUF433 family)